MSTSYLTLDDIKKLLADNLEQFKSQLTGIAGVDTALVADYTLRTQKRMAIIISGFALGDIDLSEFRSCLEDEKFMLTGFLDTLEVIAKVDAQNILKSVLKSVLESVAGVIVKIILPV